MGQFEETAENRDVSRVEGAGSDSLNLCSLTMGTGTGDQGNLPDRNATSREFADRINTLPSLTIDFGDSSANQNVSDATGRQANRGPNPNTNDAHASSTNGGDSTAANSANNEEASESPRVGDAATHARADALNRGPLEDRMKAIADAVRADGTVQEGNHAPGEIHWRAAINDMIQNMTDAEVQQFNAAFQNSDTRLQIRNMDRREQMIHQSLNPGQTYNRVMDISQREPGTSYFRHTDSIPEPKRHMMH